jgi:membrane-bound metal-dependent hydrolase YbcI (DUF457 family)
MVLGHLTVTTAARRLLGKRFPSISAIPLGPLLAGAYLPDLVDKPLNRLVGLAGRGYGHSLVVEGVTFGFLWLLLARHRVVVSAVALGVGAHLLEDWVNPRILLAPLLGPVPMAPRWAFVDSLLHFYRSGGPQVWLEIAAAAYWLAVGARRRA